MVAHQPTATLALIDDHALVLDGLATWVTHNAPDFDLVIVADSWAKLLHDPAFPPDVIVMDYQLAEPISIEARLGICRAAGTAVVVMSALDDPASVDRIMAAGAAAFVAKSRPAADVIAAARAALVGDDDSAGIQPAAYDDDRFTPTELEMLNLYANGNSPVEVALLLRAKPAAVNRALDRFRARYQREGRPVDDRESLIRRAAEDGYLT
ncbi:response regulator transcription factor [Subtercola lobariae]|uniref:DNA-binding response regulator n=1 Tax=Subtercola lobariae TaxID=1588641 RepID=A0A917B0M9_9MICO|nr:response regulator transcription factor [Subtercola lobariae]GGF12677.1 DNA-binding response regulator [Subtercola lobariae]